MPRTRMLNGTLPAVPTLLAQDEVVDREASAQFTRSLVEAGVDGLVVLGTSGEGMALPAPARDDALRIARQEAPDLPILAGCHGQTLHEAAEAVQRAAECGVEAALVPPPFYYPLRSTELCDFYEGLADAAPVPIYLYHIPQMTKNALGRADIDALSRHRNIVGLKDSHGLMLDHLELLQLQSDEFAVLQGSAPLALASYAVGGAGAITPVSALFPELELSLRRALVAGDVDDAGHYQRRIGRVATLLRSGGYSLVSNLKAVSALLGFGGGHVLRPGDMADRDHRQWLHRELAAEGLLTT